MPQRVSVIIPVLNEEAVLSRTLASVQGALETIVVDGGSVDQSVKIAEAAGAKVLQSGRGRALQMNLGARAAEGEVLLFLHADTLLPPGAIAEIESTLESQTTYGGCFQLRFDTEHCSKALWFWGWCTRCPWLKVPGLVFGDRAIFVRRSTFEKLGGYKEWKLLEDVDFATRLARAGSEKPPGCFACCPLGKRQTALAFVDMDVITAGRRLMEKGPVKQQLLNSCILACWKMGMSPDTMADWYKYKAPSLKDKACS
eukprot:TRINITY_DN100735_c0_g1_i1.p1 TRINITY_DN100735_c0_g1~~TRINITY_DN100735_c0_g1_i1.p1  ORF type:complete len:256 (-),score=32.64 TRINITY_DN100735_c0_g1_i1:236-1003(-)